MRKPRAYAEVWNDLDGEVVNLFQVLRSDDAVQLVEMVRLTPFAQQEFQNAYEPSGDPVERARRLIIRSFMGFGSNGHQSKTGFRANSNRSGTTPAHDWANYPEALAKVVSRLTGVCVSNRDALDVMQQHDSAKTLHYVDPPYVHDTRSDASMHSYAHEMTDADHEGLLDMLQGVDGMVVLSGYAHPLYDDVLEDWQRIERMAHADGAQERTEVLWLNQACVEALVPDAPSMFAAVPA